MALLSLKINIIDCCVTKTIQFDPSLRVHEACQIIRDKVPETGSGHGASNDYGLFYTEENKKSGIWLEDDRTLDYYVLRNGDLLEYKRKHRVLKVRMLDGSVKTLMADDSHTVSQLMTTICSKIGITNDDEYSLVRDLPDSEREKTMTMKRDKSIARDQKKMDEMKRKLHTDEELDWLDNGKTLREQGIEENETLLLRRKYFFSDQNVDARDPIQLNLLYVQTHDAILKGAHPVSLEKAIEFAGYQCQIQFGDHNDTNHKPGFLDLKVFLPKEYCSIKGIEKRIYQEHKNIIGLTEGEAKMKYTQQARSLKTYGITFFLVKEKLKGKNKLVPRLLGITKECVVRVDENTKEILKSWPLTTVKRWAASPNTFSLDFGDYAEDIYSVQTMEGEQISQLIAGYIDIILKKKQAKDHFGIEGDEESAMYEENVSPARAMIIQHQSNKTGHALMGSVALPANLRSGEGQDNGHVMSSMLGSGQYSKVSQLTHTGHMAANSLGAHSTGMGGAQRALLGTINESLSSINQVGQTIENRVDDPLRPTNMMPQNWMEQSEDLARQKVGAELSAMNAATAKMILLTNSRGSDSTDYPSLRSAIQTITSNLNEFSTDIRTLASFESSESGKNDLLAAAKKLTMAFSDLLTAIQPGPDDPRQGVLVAANKVGDASQDMMQKVEQKAPVELDFKDKLLSLSRAVANSTAELVLQAKQVSSRCISQEEQNMIIERATQCAMTSSQLVTCSRLVAATTNDLACREGAVDAAKMVADAVEDIANTSQQVCHDEAVLKSLGEGATNVTRSLDNLVRHVKKGVTFSDTVEHIDVIYHTTDSMCESVDNPQELVRQAQLLAKATSHLVTSLRSEAEQQSSSEEQNRLLSAAKLLAEATARMVEAAKGCAMSPNNDAYKEALRLAADKLRSAADSTTSDGIKLDIHLSLQQAAKIACAAATQLINASGLAGKSNSNAETQQKLFLQSRVVADEAIPRIVEAMRMLHKDPNNSETFSYLVKAVQDFVQPCNVLLTNVELVGPTVEDQSAHLGLVNASQNMHHALSDLDMHLSHAMHAYQTDEHKNDPVYQINVMESDLKEVRTSALNGRLQALNNANWDCCSSNLNDATKAVADAMSKLLNEALQGRQSNKDLEKQVASTLLIFSKSVKDMAAVAAHENPNGGIGESVVIIDHGIDVLQKSNAFVLDTRQSTDQLQYPESKMRLSEAVKVVTNSMRTFVSIVPEIKMNQSKRMNPAHNAPSDHKTGKSAENYHQSLKQTDEDELFLASSSDINVSSASTSKHLNESLLSHGACRKAAASVDTLVTDLDTSIMFASAGSMTAEEGETFSNYREGILKTAKELVDDTKTLVSAAATDEQQLSSAANKSVGTVMRLADFVRKGAAGLGAHQPDAQVLLMNAVKDVASALSSLISTTQVAAGKPAADPSMNQLKESAKIMVTNVTSLLKTVKTVEDEAARGVQAVESSIEAISQELKNLSTVERSEKQIAPQDIMRATRQITTATTKVVAASNSGRSEDIVSAANLGRSSVLDLLKTCKFGAELAEDVDTKNRLLSAVKLCASSFQQLLTTINPTLRKPSQETRHEVAVISKGIALSVTDIVRCAEMLKGSDWVDPHDPTVVAETELLSAANAIEAAARKLALLQPKLKPKQADESLNFEEHLLEAAKSIAAATMALVKAASAAQRELMLQGKIGNIKEDADSDSQWSQGLISAARLVAASTSNLCDAANGMVHGQMTEERLISSAKQVAASTAQLLIACKVKADPNSQAMHRLQNAGSAVKKATEALVKEAQKMSSHQTEEESSMPINNRFVTDVAQIIMAQEEILKKEKELEMARRKLETIRKAKYRPSEGDI